METPVLDFSKIPVVIENGRRLLTNRVDGRAADIWKRAKAATNAPVIIGEPGGRYKETSAVGLWVDASFTGDLKVFWQEVYRIEAARS